MFDIIQWKVFVRAKDLKKAAKVLHQVATALGEDAAVLIPKPYRKDPALFEASFTTPLKAKGVEEAVFRSLRIANKLSITWTVRPPQDYAGGKWEFGALSGEKFTIPGVEMVEFETRNYV